MQLSFVTVKDNAFMLTLLGAFLPSQIQLYILHRSFDFCKLLPDNVIPDFLLASTEKSRSLSLLDVHHAHSSSNKLLCISKYP